MFESKSGIFFIAGVGFFLLAFLGNGIVPMIMYKDRPEQTAEQVVNTRTLTQFRDLQSRYPEAFEAAFGEASAEACAAALRLGRQIYVGEGCWHCHSQFVRPVSNESRRFGPVSKSEEYDNELQRPVLFGMRRVGPDLSREGGAAATTGMRSTSTGRRPCRPTRRCPSIPGSSTDRPTSRTVAGSPS